MIWLTVN